MRTFVTRSAQETTHLGKSFATKLRPGDVVAFFGDLGTGKTQFIKGVCEGLAVTTTVGSPTFTLINEYEAPFGIVAHIDLYRIGSPSELRELGLDEYFNDRCVCLVEWAETVLDRLPLRRYEVRMRFGSDEQEREIAIAEREGVHV